ncbi:PQLLE family protein [Marinilabilia sp.]|jgi:predicted transcriptional regulator
MHYSKLPFENFVDKVDNVLGQSLSDQNLVSSLSSFGYGLKEMEQGRELLEMLRQIDQEQEAAQRRRKQLNKEKNELYREIQRRYMRIVKIGRIVFDDDVMARGALGLDGPREKQFDDWYRQVYMFCKNLLAEEKWMKSLSNYGVKKLDLKNILVDLEKLEELNTRFEHAKTLSKEMTQKKRKQLLLLQDWLSDYLKIARLALEEKPQLLEKLLN